MKSVVFAVIKREYLQRVRSKWFVAATIGAPLLFLALMLVPALLAGRSEQNERRIVVVDETGVLFEQAVERIGEAGFEASLSERNDAVELDSLRARVVRGEIGGVLILDQATIDRGAMTYVTEKQPSTIRSLGLRQAVVQSALAVRLGATDISEVRALLSGGDIEMDIVGEGSGFEDVEFLQAYIGAFFLYMSLLIYAIQVMRSVLEEKRDKVVEIVVSSMRPFDLMLGKILGVGAVGLTQLGIWIGSAILILMSGLPAMLASNPEAFDSEFIAQVMPGMSYAALLLTFFLCGYFLYSSLYAAVGAMCNTDEEAQQAQFPVILLLIIPITFVMMVIQEPRTTLSITLSWIPFFSPILMFARAVGGGAALWEVIGSVVVMSATVVGVAWVAGRIYKVGILMTGKRPTLPELVRWIREA